MSSYIKFYKMLKSVYQVFVIMNPCPCGNEEYFTIFVSLSELQQIRYSYIVRQNKFNDVFSDYFSDYNGSIQTIYKRGKRTRRICLPLPLQTQFRK